jgi:MoxR-like ATPase
MRAARAGAVLEGRDYVVPDDIKALVRPVWRHRLLVRPESALRGRNAAAVLDGILAETTLDLGDAN